MQIKRILGLAVAVAMTVGMSTAANAKLPYPYNNKAANLQAMQWYAQQQAAQGNYGYYGYGTNPYYNSNLYNGYYGTPYNSGYYNNYNTVNPYYGYNGSGYWF